MAKELSSLVKEIDLNLQGSDFLEFADRVSRFKSLLDWSVWSLLDANAESEYTFQCLMNGMAKYRKACFSIPIAVRADNESQLNENGRSRCARSLLMFAVGCASCGR